jgi:hypothetical protein
VSNPREDIFAAVTSALEGITISNGYAVDVDKVYRLDVVPDEMPSTVRRALCVLESLTPEDWSGDLEGCGAIDAKLPIVIAGVVRAQTTDLKSSDRHTQLNALISATAKALMTDPTFGGACKDSKFTSGPVGLVDTDKGEALFNLTLRCHYIFTCTDL